MDGITIVLFVTVLLAFGVIIVLLIRNNQKPQQNGELLQHLMQMRSELNTSSNEHRKEVQEHLSKMHDRLHSGMSQSHNSIQRQFEQTSKIIKDVTEKLGTLESTNKQVLDFSSQLKNLQDILKNPKQRGVLGEYWLDTLLANVMPTKDLYQMQYTLGEDEKTGQKLIADAVIFINDQTIPIDAKFTLENYNRMMAEHDPERRDKLEKDFKADVKKRIDETSKYIRPELGTTSFAFMFIPAEGVYYNLLNAEVGSGVNSNNLVEYAFTKNVMLVSPTSFYAYLQTVLMGLKKLEIEQKTQEIIKRVGELDKHMNSYADIHRRLGKNLATVVNQYDQSSNELRKVHKDTIRITSGTTDDLVEFESIQKPSIE